MAVDMRRRFMNKKNTSYIPFYIEALEDNVSYSFPYFESEYKINDGEWITLPIGEKSDVISKGERIYINARYSYSSISNIGISIEGECRIGGCVMSLCIGEIAERNNILVSDYQFQNLFYNCTTIREVEKNFLYYDSLTSSCYSYMFYGCTSLVQAPELPATTLTSSCYSYMFYGCTSLVQAPELPATTLTSSCYASMFKGCSNLNYIKMLATDLSASDCSFDWVEGVSLTGTFVKSKDATWDAVGANGVPAGWTVKTDDSENGNSKMVNIGILKSMGFDSYKLEWTYPVASQVKVGIFTGISVQVLVTNNGSSTSFNSLVIGPGESIEKVDYIEPIEDESYVYEVAIG